MRTLAGNGTGVLLAQQTAANLHAAPGDTISIGRAGGAPAQVRVDGVVDLPTADSLFQTVGAPPGAQASAPPDNVVLLPRSSFDALALRGATIQVHAGLAHSALPGSPSAAYKAINGRALNLETRLSGGGRVGDNLGSALDQARKDSLYAQLLFLFLGLPGAILAGLVTATIASAGAGRRRRDSALLRARGATSRQLVRLALAEAGLAGGIGIAVGLAAALAIGAASFGTASFGASTTAAVLWAGGAALAGLLVAAGAIALPAWHDARSLTVASQRQSVGRVIRAPWWQRAGLDVIALVLGGLVFWQASKGGYNLVLAPEGVAQVSVNWYALLAPVLIWIGAGLLAFRCSDVLLRHGRRLADTGSAAGRRPACADRRGDDGPPEPSALARLHAGGADRRVRGLHRRLQRDLRAAGGGRCAVDQWR